MIELAFWLVIVFTYAVLTVWAAKLILEAIFLAMAKGGASPRPVRVETPHQRSEFDRAA